MCFQMQWTRQLLWVAWLSLGLIRATWVVSSRMAMAPACPPLARRHDCLCVRTSRSKLKLACSEAFKLEGRAPEQEPKFDSTRIYTSSPHSSKGNSCRRTPSSRKSDKIDRERESKRSPVLMARMERGTTPRSSTRSRIQESTTFLYVPRPGTRFDGRGRILHN